jgi:GPI-GlcNAc transferase complex PIG-U subunit
MRSILSEFTDLGPFLRRSIHELLNNPNYKRLRWILATGLFVRAILIPLSSWTSDTPGFVLGDLALIYHGNPYLATTFFNPPLASFLSAPLFGVLALFLPPGGLIQFQPSLLPVASGVPANFYSPWLPSSLALVALKLPLAVADLGAALTLVVLSNRMQLRRSGTWMAAAYFLNPLTVWATSVQGEPDGLAAFFVLVALAAAIYDRPLTCGIAIGLGIASKAYPMIFVPALAAVWLAPTIGSRQRGESVVARIGMFLVGIGAPLVIFLPYIGFISSALARASSAAIYGGISVLTFYNSGAPPLGGLTADLRSHVRAGSIEAAFVVLAAIAIVGSAVLVYRSMARSPSATPGARASLLSVAMLWVASGLLIAYVNPQPENILAALAPSLLVAGQIRGRYSWAPWALAGSGFGLYMAYGTPLIGFFPLLVALGGDWTRWGSSVALAYANGSFLMPASYYWFIPGVIGGSVLIGLWILAFVRLIPPDWKMEVRRRLGKTRASAIAKDS